MKSLIKTRSFGGRLPAPSVLLLLLALLIPLQDLSAKRERAEYGPVDRIVVIGDIHGDYDKMIDALTIAGLIDRRKRWAGGRTHLVQMGDLPDRGPDTLKIINYLQKLERQAKRRKGRVHILIGNHDAMNVYGDMRYVSEGEYEAFATRQSEQRLEMLYDDEVAWIKNNVPEEEWPEFNDEFKKNWIEARPLGFVEHRYHWLPDGEIGDWVLTHNAVMKIGDYLFVHGGIGPGFVDYSIDQINDAVTEALKDPPNVEGTILRTETGPLWYRGMARHPEAEELPHFEAVLESFGVTHVIMAHTPTKGVILPRFGGRGIITDVGLTSYYGDNLACLLIENGEFFAIHENGRVKIPQGGGEEEVIRYLEEVAALEPGHKAIAARIEYMKNKAIEFEEEEDEAVNPD